ncbi:MAG: hypothetical protein RL017_29 [Pseudomonadota bacterium]
MIKKIILINFFLILANISLAIVPATVDRTNIDFGQSFTLTINVSNSNGTPDLSPLNKDFTIYSSNQNSQTNIINGKYSSISNLIVTLIPNMVGKLIIPPISVGNDHTNPIVINVNHATNEINQNSDMFLSSTINSKNIYVNSPIIYTIKLFFTSTISNLRMQPLNIERAQIQQLGKSNQYQTTQNGKIYQVIEQQFMITPTQAGKIVIPPAQISGVKEQSNNSFFFDQNTPFSLASKEIDLIAKPIPTSVNSNFWFPANNVTINDNWSNNSNSIKIGDPLTRTITITADGVAADTIPNFTFQAPNDVNSYPDKVISNTTPNGNNVTSTKIFKIAYIPIKSESLIFPAVTINWWDLHSDRLRSIQLPERQIQVLANPNLQSVTTAPTNLTNLVKPQLANTIINNPTSAKVKTWQLTTCVLFIIWLITLGFAINWKRKLQQRVMLDNFKLEQQQQDIIKHKRIINEIKNACQMQDLVKINSLLIIWGKNYLNEDKIYNSTDLKKYISDEDFGRIIDKLNLALYKNTKFEDFASIESIIEKLSANVKHFSRNKSQVLDTLYPTIDN